MRKKKWKGSTKKSVQALKDGAHFNSIYKNLKCTYAFFPKIFFFKNLPFEYLHVCMGICKGIHYRTIYNCEKQKQPNYTLVGE